MDQALTTLFGMMKQGIIMKSSLMMKQVTSNFYNARVQMASWIIWFIHTKMELTPINCLQLPITVVMPEGLITSINQG